MLLSHKTQAQTSKIILEITFGLEKLQHKNLKPRSVSQKKPKLELCCGNPRHNSLVTKFKIINFGVELLEINFKYWNMPKCRELRLTGRKLPYKSYYQAHFDFRKTMKNWVFSFREITLADRPKLEKSQKN